MLCCAAAAPVDNNVKFYMGRTPKPVLDFSCTVVVLSHQVQSVLLCNGFSLC